MAASQSYKLAFSPDMAGFKEAGMKAARDFSNNFKKGMSGQESISETISKSSEAPVIKKPIIQTPDMPKMPEMPGMDIPMGGAEKFKNFTREAGGMALKFGKVAAVGFGAAATGLGALGGAAIAATADIQQSMGGAEAVFVESSGVIKTWAGSAAGSMGITTNEALQTANKMGSLFQGAGHTIADSAEMTMGYSQRAADVASIMGVDLSSAMEAVTGAAKGNFEMMDNLGVAMNATTLEAYAQSKGIDKTWESMTNAEKTGLAYQMFMEKTAQYAGNFEKENQTLAGSFDILKSSWGNVMSSISDPEMLDGALTQLSTAVTNVLESLKTSLPSIVKGIGTLLKDGLPIILDTILALLPELVTLLKDAVPVLLEGIITALPPLIEGLLDAVLQLLPVIIDGILYIVEALVPMFPELMAKILPALLEGIWMLLLGVLRLFGMMPKLFMDYITSTFASLGVLFGGIGEMFGADGGAIIEAVARWGEGIKQKFSEMFMNLINGLNEFALNFAVFWINLFNNVKNSIVNFFVGVREEFNQKIGEITGFFASIPDRIAAVFKNVSDIGRDIVDGIWNGIKAKLSWLTDKIKGFARGIKNTITDFFDINSPSKLMEVEVGRNIALGVGAGLIGSERAVVSDAKRFSASISRAVDINPNVGDPTPGSMLASGGNNGGPTVNVNVEVEKPKDMLDMHLNQKRATIAGLAALGGI